jgi:AraC-like DNA-binding protein
MKATKSEFLPIKVTKTALFDGILHKTANFANRKFPAHFHQEYSLALIETGSENLLVQGQNVHLPAGSLVLLPPNLVHAHEGVSPWQYQAIYLSADVVNFALRDSNLSIKNLPKTAISYFSENQNMTPFFKKLTDSVKKEADFAENVAKIFHFLQKKEITAPPFSNQNHPETMAEIRDFIEKNHAEKITLDALCVRFQFEKFNLLRHFKQFSGLTPIQYLLAMRIESVKKAMFSTQSLVEIAFQHGFYDQSHFCHCFQKYVGTSPEQYRLGIV